MSPNKKLKTSESGEKEKKVSKTKTASEKDFGAYWREKCKDIHAINIRALRKGVLTDVTFVVGQESVAYRAHRLILALGSPVFEAMFYGALAEKGDTITIPDVDQLGFRFLLRFLYSDEIIFPNDVVAFKTYFAADKYCVTHLKDRCEKYLCRCKLTPANVWIFLENALFLNSQPIKNRCFCFLKYNTEAALRHSSFLDIRSETVETLLCLDFLNITEMKLLLNIVRWAEHSDSAGSSLQTMLSSLLRFVRFGALSAPEFINFLETQKLKGLLTDRDALDILKHINLPLSCALPTWCCTKTYRNKECRPRSKSRKRSFALSHSDFSSISSSSASSSTSSSSYSSSSSTLSSSSRSSDSD